QSDLERSSGQVVILQCIICRPTLCTTNTNCIKSEKIGMRTMRVVQSSSTDYSAAVLTFTIGIDDRCIVQTVYNDDASNSVKYGHTVSANPIQIATNSRINPYAIFSSLP